MGTKITFLGTLATRHMGCSTYHSAGNFDQVAWYISTLSFKSTWDFRKMNVFTRMYVNIFTRLCVSL